MVAVSFFLIVELMVMVIAHRFHRLHGATKGDSRETGVPNQAAMSE
jgi:hypothetical protein